MIMEYFLFIIDKEWQMHGGYTSRPRARQHPPPQTSSLHFLDSRASKLVE